MKAAASWTVYLACSIFPIKKNKIVFSAFDGGGYGCNPKYIAEEIIRRSKLSGKNFELIWLVPILFSSPGILCAGHLLIKN